MLAIASHPFIMSDSASTAAPKRPRLSLKTSTIPTIPGRCALIDSEFETSSPTVLNTLTNAYALAIEQCSPRSAGVSYAITSTSGSALGRPTPSRLAKLVTVGQLAVAVPERVSTPCPCAVSKHPESTSSYTIHTALTARRWDLNNTDVARNEHAKRPCGELTSSPVPPYTQPSNLKSILRNSPMTMAVPSVPPKAKTVHYDTPLTQMIITDQYTRTHIDLLCDTFSPNLISFPLTPADGLESDIVDINPNNIEDGGRTPGPREELRRREGESLIADRERKRVGKKRRWVWTIGNEEEDTLKS